MLVMQCPIGFGDGIYVQHAIRPALIAQLRTERKKAFSFDPAIDDEMGDVNVLGAEFPRDALCEIAQGGLGSRERREIGFAAQASRGAREKQRAAAML